MANDIGAKMIDTLIRIKREQDGVTVEGRDLIGEAMRDRPYNPNPYQTHSLANSRLGSSGSGSGFPNWPPRSIFTHPHDGQWMIEADGREFVAPTALEAENAMRAHYGQPPLRAEGRNPLDDAPKGQGEP
jgi:hypothetical protein